MQSACPSCGVMYNLNPQLVGRRLTCKKCGATVAVEPDGLRLESAAPAAPETAAESEPAYEPPAPVPFTPARAKPAPSGNMFGALLNDPFTWLFAGGSLLIILFLFLPLVDLANVTRHNAKIESGDALQRRMDREFQEKNTKSNVDIKARDDARKDWDKTKANLTDDVEDVKADAQTSRYWYMWGMMLGFLLLAAGAIGYLTPGRSQLQRIVGAVVICSLLFLVFIAFVASSTAARLAG